VFPRVSIIILNWNGWGDTIECLESLYKITYPNYDVIVVDNGSHNDSIQKIKEYADGKIEVGSKFFEYNPYNKPIRVFEISEDEARQGKFNRSLYEKFDINRRMILIKNKSNYGFAGGNNIGIKFALSVLNPEYVLLLNNDTVVDKKFLDELVRVVRIDREIALCQPKILNYFEEDRLDSTGNLMDIFGSAISRGYGEYDKGQYNNEMDTGFFYTSGACLLISKDFLNMLGNEPFDSKLFAYHEDVDISWTARLFGFKVLYWPKASCFHKFSKTSAKINYLKHELIYRNRLRVILKNYSSSILLWIFPLTISLEVFSAILSYLSKRDNTFLFILVKALSWNLKNLKDTTRKRHIVQSKRVVCDVDIMRYMVKFPLGIYLMLKRVVR